MGVITSKIGMNDKGASVISRLLGVVKFQSATEATAFVSRTSLIFQCNRPLCVTIHIISVWCVSNGSQFTPHLL